MSPTRRTGARPIPGNSWTRCSPGCSGPRPRTTTCASLPCRVALSSPCRLGRVVQPEPDLQGDLEVLDAAVGDVAPDLGDLEPAEVAKRLVRPPDGVADGLFQRLVGRADDL